jgi:hypothetical protein
VKLKITKRVNYITNVETGIEYKSKQWNTKNRDEKEILGARRKCGTINYTWRIRTQTVKLGYNSAWFMTINRRAEVYIC